MKYTIQEIDEKTARLIIQWTPRPDVCARPIALRHCFDDQRCLDRTKGAVLGFDATFPCAMLLLVQGGDLISLGEKIVGGGSASWAHYQIGPGFTVEAIANEDQILPAARIRELMLPEVASFQQAPGDDEALREFIPMVRMPPECIPPGLESDILHSIASFPLVWLNRYGSFVTAMEKIARHLSIHPDGAALRELQQRMDPSGREAFFHLIADRI